MLILEELINNFQYFGNQYFTKKQEIKPLKKQRNYKLIVQNKQNNSNDI